MSVFAKFSFKGKKIKLFIAVFILICVLSVFFSKYAIIRHYIYKEIRNFNNHSNSEILIEDISFESINMALFKNIVIRNKHFRDSLIYIDNAKVELSTLNLLKFKIKPDKIQLNRLKLHIIDKNGYNNLNEFFIRKTGAKKSLKEKNYAKLVDRIFKTLFGNIPADFSINSFNALLEINTGLKNFIARDIHYSGENLITEVNIKDLKESNTNNLLLKFTKDNDNQKIILFLINKDSNKINIPYRQDKRDLYFAFDTISIIAVNKGFKEDKLTFEGNLLLSKLSLNHPDLAQNDIIIENSGIDYKLNIGKNYLELDSISQTKCNKLTVYPYIKYENEGKGKLTLKIKNHNFKSQDLFQSLPKGLFNNLKGIQVSGTLSFNLNFYCDFNMPDSLQFTSSLDKKDFRIIKMGQENLAKINEAFEFTAYDKNIPIKTFILGEQNPDFVPISSISPYLIPAILTSEDGNFYFHKGFNEEAFKLAIIKNIKEKRFARGGSTISMQLVKNVFLKRNKNISRKLEEALIVWLIENNALSTKERMMEIYINIIEWGPEIYGIKEASKFYFDKKPNQLNLAECIYLASIIPHPKWYKYSFEEDGQFKEHVKEFYKLVSEKMLRKKYISEEEAAGVIPEIRLRDGLLNTTNGN